MISKRRGSSSKGAINKKNQARKKGSPDKTGNTPRTWNKNTNIYEIYKLKNNCCTYTATSYFMLDYLYI
jgi:hypothetical protein